MTMAAIQQLEALTSTLSVPVYIWQRASRDFICVGANRAAEERHGGLTATLRGARAREVFRERPARIEEMVRTMDTDTIRGATIDCDLHSGGTRLLNVTLARHSAEYLIALVADGAGSDAESGLAAMYLAALNVVCDALAVIEAQAPQHRIVCCNEAFLELAGAPAATLQGRPFARLFAGGAVAAAVERVAEEGVQENIARCALREGAAARDVSVQIIPYPPGAPSPQRLFVVLRALAASAPAPGTGLQAGSPLTRRFAGIVYRRRADAAWTLDGLDGQCELLTGYVSRELLAADRRGFSALIHPDDRERAVGAVARASAAQPHFEIEYRLCHRNGRYRHVRDRGTLLCDGDGAVQAVEGLIEDVTEYKTLLRRLDRSSRTDALTGALNLAELVHRLERLLEDSGDGAPVHTLLYIDVDGFRVLNEEAGPDAGSEYLCALVRQLKHRVRRRDEVARVGADRFAVLLDRCPADKAQAIAEAVRETVEAFRFRWSGKDFQLTVSIGLCPFGDVAATASEILTFTDQACNTAKDLGRNRVLEFDPADQRFRQRRSSLRMVSEINTSLSEDRLVLYGQPIRPLNGERRGLNMEVLVRLTDADGVLLQPHAFLPAAERYGLAPRIDRWVVRATLARLMGNPGALAALDTCAVNVSARTLGDGAFLGFVTELLEELRFPAHKLCFEITETAVIRDLQQALAFIDVLQGLGCRFALDDFGAGMSSFGYLKQLSVDIIKIDGQFVRNIANDRVDLEIVKAATAIARSSGKETVAEFVESADILRHLEHIGVDYVQGYFIGKPRPLGALLDEALASA